MNSETKPENGNEANEKIELTCGFGNWRPEWLQKFATPKVFLINFSLVAIFQGASFTYLIGSMTTLEKRYGFESKISGFILIADNLSQMIINPFIGYLGTKYNRPVIMAIGEIVVALAQFMCAIPYFVYGPNDNLLKFDNFHNSSQKYELCDANREAVCTDSSATIWPAVIILWMASFVNGLGYTAFYTVGLPYIDDNTSKKNSPMYLSFSAAIRLLGPSLGFLLSSACLSLYENPFDAPNIAPNDPRWIGAWWIGYLIIGSFLFLFSIPLLIFPTHMKSTNIPQVENDKTSAIDSLKRLMKNPIFMFNLFGMCLRLLGYLGYYLFKPKYIEAQFKKSASNANFWTGLTSIPTMAIGIMAGGIFLSKFRPKARKVVIYMFVIELITNTAILTVMFLKCPHPVFPQTSLIDGNLDLKAYCNENCKCSQRSFQPVCADDGISNYFSPCHAGCKTFDKTISTFSDCSCVGSQSVVTNGYCETDCNKFPLYISILGVAGVIMSTAKIGDTLLTLRCVEPRDKNFAMGIIGSFMAVFAFIPYPLIFGTITDMACIVWKESCGKTGNCWLYDIEKFRYYLHLSSFMFLMIGTLFDIPIIIYANRIKNMFEDEQESQDNIDQPHEMGNINKAFNDSIDNNTNVIIVQKYTNQQQQQQQHQQQQHPQQRRDSLKDYELVHRKNSFVTL